MADIYVENMSRSASEAHRLDEQFELITKNIGFLLHPVVQANLPPNPRVADVATGTGVFLHHIHRQYPGAVLHGFDISSDLFPKVTPQGLRLSVLDVKEPIPEDLRGKYDLVHVRMLAAAMLPDEWAPVVRNVSMLLKPGGWLQWEECDFSGVKHLRGPEGSHVDTARRLGRAFRTGLLERFQHGWSTLPDDMRASGLGSVVSDCVSSDRVPETRERLTANGMRAIISWARLMAARGVPESIGSGELVCAEKAAYEDIKSGGYVRFDIHIACGQKPSI